MITHVKANIVILNFVPRMNIVVFGTSEKLTKRSLNARIDMCSQICLQGCPRDVTRFLELTAR